MRCAIINLRFTYLLTYVIMLRPSVVQQIEVMESRLSLRRLQFAGHCFRRIEELTHSVLVFELQLVPFDQMGMLVL